jgi:protocatechuate 3,4-dioxygenase beta subunit
MVLFVCNLAAQNASLNGTVKDQQGGLVPAAAITLTGTATGVVLSAATDNDGNFEFPTVRPGERVSIQLRGEAFNLFNHPNFAQPSNNVVSTTFGTITATRTARGDLGSSRQLQLGIKLLF